MVNAVKYLVLLESCLFDQAADTKKRAERLTHNLNVLEKFVKIDVEQQFQQLCTAFKLSDFKTELIVNTKDNVITAYVIRLEHVIYNLFCNINFDSDAKEDLISVAHLKLCIQAVQELCYYALRCQLHKGFYRLPFLKDVKSVETLKQPLLLLTVELFKWVLPIRQLHIANSMEFVIRDYLALLMTLKVETKQANTQLDAALSYLWTYESKSDYFRNVLLLKATPDLPVPLANGLHQELMAKLNGKLGFASLVAALQIAPNLERSRAANIVANIVARPSYSAEAQKEMISQVFEFCLHYAHVEHNADAGVLTLRRFYDLNVANQQTIKNTLAKHWEPITEPKELIKGLIAMEQTEMCDLIALWHQLFCSSSVACLPSLLLVDYIELLLQLYNSLSQNQIQSRQLTALVTCCLHNMETADALQVLIERLYKLQLLPTSKPIHGRIEIVPVSDFTRFSAKVSTDTYTPQFHICDILPTLLMSSDHHILTYNVFIVLLRFMAKNIDSRPMPMSDIDLLSTEAELADFLNTKYQMKLDLLNSLNLLVSFKPLKSQLAEHGDGFMQILRQLLQQRVDAGAVAADTAEFADNILLLILILLKEQLESSRSLLKGTRELKTHLKQLSIQTSNELVKERVSALLSLIDGDWKASVTHEEDSFQKARGLMEQQESYQKVHGIQMLIKLLKKRDTNTMSQGHLIIALALTMLKDKESYTFLNCVRLFTALVPIMESEVLDKLADEYLSETAELDYRLVVGETILNVANQLGPLCYKYKTMLLNCFMHGVCSQLDELRMSAYANLAQLCRLLTYQVAANFFQELLRLIDDELNTGRYLPAKRAAVLVLVELLEGIDDLINFQEMLLPIYRLLRILEASEACDAQIRQHAANGLKILNAKCQKLLQFEETLCKEIKVLGIKDKPTKRNHILELN